ncbi:MAG: PilZ domain-containing protein [Erythrobacter sp.]
MSALRNEDSNPEERDFLRLPLGVLGYLETLEGRKRVEVVDLSQGGAHIVLLEVDEKQTIDIEDCFLTWLDFEGFGKVTWRKGQHFGIAFEEPLRPTVIKETKIKAPMMVRRDFDELKVAAKLWAKGIYPTY